MQNADSIHSLTFSNTPTEREIALIRQKMGEYNRAQTNGEYDKPGIEIYLVLKDSEGNIVGGVSASTQVRVMYLEALWVADEYRKRGYGTDLVLAAERIGFDKGCITSHTWSLSFQAPGFYQKIGYALLGVYDGYPDGITEYVLSKRLQPDHQVCLKENGRFPITAEVTEEDMEIVQAGLGRYVDEQIGNKRGGIGIKLVIKDCADDIIGGLLAFTTMRNLVIELLWLDERYRGRGLGKKLLLEAERIATEHGCIAVQASALSFQSPDFFRRMGYVVFGMSDGYPDPVKEYYLIKRFKSHLEQSA
ncbi:MAG TPA: GNAT family N-acetyltransferase [Anaerolineae bacterium]|nr:GNAT family N-acetyltransferase [Anaerolineae bacterium]HQI84757.1 GNAT family N-acetyltransferase [Anaerolineae bacterium]